MNICFIIGPYIPGKCGISDFISILSHELAKSGHSYQIRSVDPMSGQTFPKIARNLSAFDLISMQFSPYSFSENGLSGNDLKIFSQQIKNKLVQIIFHEIWIGDYIGSSLIQKFKGWRQKQEIQNFIHCISPTKIYATNAASLHRLQKSGIPADYLYLFGNIPYNNKKFDSPKKDPNLLFFVFFGTLYKKFPFKRTIIRLTEISEITGRKIKICVIGRQREKVGIRKLRKLATRNMACFQEVGEVSVIKASHYLQIADFGISTTPFDSLGKSGTTAAMLEHGLHVIAFDDRDTPNIEDYVSGPIVDQIILLDDEKMENKVLRVLEKGNEKPYRGVLKTVPAMIENFI